MYCAKDGGGASAPQFSASAIEKIEEMGGEAIEL